MKDVILNFNNEDIKVFNIDDKWTKEWLFFNGLFPTNPDKTINKNFGENIKNLFKAIIFFYIVNKKWNDILKIENNEIYLYFKNGNTVFLWKVDADLKINIKKWWNLETAVLQYISNEILSNDNFWPIIFTIMYNVYFPKKKYTSLEKCISVTDTVNVLNTIYERLFIKKQSV